jgi:hypothetical protein
MRKSLWLFALLCVLGTTATSHAQFITGTGVVTNSTYDPSVNSAINNQVTSAGFNPFGFIANLFSSTFGRLTNQTSVPSTSVPTTQYGLSYLQQGFGFQVPQPQP